MIEGYARDMILINLGIFLGVIVGALTEKLRKKKIAHSMQKTH